MRATMMLVVVGLVVGPIKISPARAEAGEEFNFVDIAPTPAGREGGANMKAAELKSRSAPVSSAGALNHSVQIQVPPGRNGMTPALGLSYSSSGRNTTSPAGAGWSIEIPQITRSQRRGFPKLIEDNGIYTYSEVEFSSPAGTIVRAVGVDPNTAGPSGATGTLYVPRIERAPVRYEYVSSDDRWIEHDPSGVKRYYGVGASGGYSARLDTPPLGTYAWLLVREEDPFGNRIDYTYHLGSVGDLNEQPLLSSVRWGGNNSAGMGDIFEVVFTVQPISQRHIDLRNGRTVLTNRYDAVHVRRIGEPDYWWYDLVYQQSSDSGRDLLSQVIRHAPGEASRANEFTYSSNASIVQHFAVEAGLPAALAQVYRESSVFHVPPPAPGVDDPAAYAAARKQAAAPLGRRSGFKFVDADGDGDTDVLYHPAGVGVVGAPVMDDGPSRQNLQGAFVSLAGAFPIHQDLDLSALGDMDGDGDLDGLGFRWEELRGMKDGIPDVPVWMGGKNAPAPADFLCSTASCDFCDDDNYAQNCGILSSDLINPVPGGYQQDPLGPGWDINPSGYNPYDQMSGSGWTGSFGVPNFTPSPTGNGPDGFDYPGDPTSPIDPPPAGDLGLPLCGCYAVCRDPMCVVQGPQRQEIEELNNPPIFLDGVQAHVVLNQAIPGGTATPFRVGFRGWPDEIIDRLQLDYDPSNQPRAMVMSTFSAPFTDLDGDGSADVTLLKYKFTPVDVLAGMAKFPIVTFTPRAYFAQDEHFVSDLNQLSLYPGTQRHVAQFSESLVAALSPSDADGCVDELRCLREALTNRYGDSLNNADLNTCIGGLSSCLGSTTYPLGIDFSAFFLDVNSDGLADLVAAHPPEVDGGSVKTCIDGHRVLLNEGYRFETWTSPTARTYPAETWSSPRAGVNTQSDALSLLRNRSPFCTGSTAPGANEFAAEPSPLQNLPMAASAMTDVNADGRTDIVFAFLDGPSSATQLVFLNTGTGFVAPNATMGQIYSYALPSDLFFAALQQTSGATIPRAGGGSFVEPGTYNVTYGDAARFVDIDDDGLVDIIKAGVCNQAPPGELTVCAPPRWQRNLGVVPDLLDRIETEGGGWTQVSYISAGSALAQQIPVVTSNLVPKGMMVVSQIDSAAGPIADGFDTETTELQYQNYVKVPRTSEVLGFEVVTATFQNRFDGLNTETLYTSRRFDVRQSIPGETPLVDYPLRGRLVEEISAGSGTTMTNRYEYVLQDLAENAIRVRSRANELVMSPSSVRSGALVDLPLDVHGYPLSWTSGPMSAPGVLVSFESSVAETRAYAHDPSAWILGRPSSEVLLGYSSDILGVGDARARLHEKGYTYDGAELRTEARMNITPAACIAGPDDTTEYQYNLLGQVTQTIRPETTTTNSYDTDSLYVNGTSTPYTRYVDGQATIQDVMTMQSAADVRHGALTMVVDPAGNTAWTDYDSLGRATERRGPAGQVLERSVYTDTYPVRVDVEVYRTQGVKYDRRDHVDGNGSVMASLMIEGGQTERVVRTRHDSFGRGVRAYHPTYSANLDDLSIAPGTPYDSMVFDAFDRPTSIVSAGGQTTTFAYDEPNEVLEVDPRGYATHRKYDWRGDLIQVLNYAGPWYTSGLVNHHGYYRDGAGRIISIGDSDGTERQIERDAAGRVHKINLPHSPQSTPDISTFCHRYDDRVVSAESPEQRSATMAYDELGRAIASTITSQSSSSTRYLTYDATFDAKGRLSRVVDAAGATEFRYDTFGRVAQRRLEPDAALKDHPGVADAYVALSNYNDAGQPTFLSVSSTTQGTTTWFFDRTFDYGTFGRPTSATSDDGSGVQAVLSNFDHDVHGRLTSVSFGNGAKAGWSYDPLRPVLRDILYGDGATTFAQASYPDIDPNGNIERELRYDATGFVVAEKIHTFDTLDRLTSTIFNHPTGAATESYDYSTAGNVNTAGGDAYSYNRTNNAQAVTELARPNGYKRTLDYDDDGLLISDISKDPSNNADRARFVEFDGAGCLTDVQTVDIEASTGITTSNTLTTHLCDINGVRAFRRQHDFLSGATSRVIWFGDIAEIRPDEGLLRSKLSVASATLDEAFDLATGDRNSAASAYRFADVRGSVLAHADFNGPPSFFTAEAEYGPWGETTEWPGSSTPVYQYTGSEPDAADGFYHFGRRVYDPTLRRWLSPDPLVLLSPEIDLHLGTQLNLYSYAQNNPVIQVDPSGFVTQLAGAAVVVGAGVGVGEVLIVAGGFLGVVAIEHYGQELSAGARSLGQRMALSAGQYRTYSNDAMEVEGASLADVQLSNATQAEPLARPVTIEARKKAPKEAVSNVPEGEDPWRTYKPKGDGTGGSAKKPKSKNVRGAAGGKEHKSNARGSTKGKHQAGQARKRRDRGGERADSKRRVPNKRPGKFKGSYPPKDEK